MRPSGRKLDQMREVSVEVGFTKHAEGSALIKMGDTHVLCTASIEPRVPPFIKGSGLGPFWDQMGALAIYAFIVLTLASLRFARQES